MSSDARWHLVPPPYGKGAPKRPAWKKADCPEGLAGVGGLQAGRRAAATITQPV